MPAIIFDTELTRFNGEIISAAWLKVRLTGLGAMVGSTLTEQDCGEQFYRPDQKILFSAMATHHILPEELEDKPHFTSFKFPEFDQPLQYVIGHSIDTDLAAVEAAGTNTSHLKRICTLGMSRLLWPELDSHSLVAIAYYTAANRYHMRHLVKNAHSASGDCLITAKVLDAIVMKTGIDSMEDLYQFSEQARYPIYMYRGKQKGQKISDMTDRDLSYWLNRNDLDAFLQQALYDEYNSREQCFQASAYHGFNNSWPPRDGVEDDQLPF